MLNLTIPINTRKITTVVFALSKYIVTVFHTVIFERKFALYEYGTLR
jgi:hypothetical protein